MDIITYSLCKKLCKSAVSGVKSYRVEGLNLIIVLNDGTELTMAFPVPEVSAVELRTATLEFDNTSTIFNLPIDDVKVNVYVNGIYLTENVDYTINRDVHPNQIEFELVYEDFESCTITYLKAGPDDEPGDVLDSIDFATPDDIDNMFDFNGDVGGIIGGGAEFATTADIDKLFNFS